MSAGGSSREPGDPVTGEGAPVGRPVKQNSCADCANKVLSIGAGVQGQVFSLGAGVQGQLAKVVSRSAAPSVESPVVRVARNVENGLRTAPMAAVASVSKITGFVQQTSGSMVIRRVTKSGTSSGSSTPPARQPPADEDDSWEAPAEDAPAAKSASPAAQRVAMPAAEASGADL